MFGKQKSTHFGNKNQIYFVLRLTLRYLCMVL